MSTATSRVLVEVAGLPPTAPTRVTFPLDQPGISALIGFYESDGRSYVLKVAKSDEVRRWALGGHPVREPRQVRIVRQVSARWNSLAPRASIWPTLEAFNTTCHEWLGSLRRETAEKAVRQVRGAHAAAVAELVDELFQSRAELRFARHVSDTVRITFPDRGPENIFAVVQENIGSLDAPAIPFSRPIRCRHRTRAARLGDLEFLTLLAYAGLLADSYGLGLDLAPRFTSGRISVPNVLVRRATGALVYIDYFGLAQRDGNAIEAGAFGALYGRWGAARHLSAWVYRGLTR